MDKKIDSNAIAAAFDSVYEFNDISKQFEGDPREGLDLQLDLIWEEYTETIAAMDDGCSGYPNIDRRTAEIELLDGACDLFVVVVGLLQKLQNAGFNVQEALQRVTDNNLSKFPTSINPQDWNWYESQKWTPVYNDSYGKFVLKDENGKSRKPINYCPVNIYDLVPTTLFKEVV